ncbi:Solute carrier family 35 member B1 [Chelonia mydas]|uniref:Solute carrier family 35 member B1 n=1 Tax=Chelonia mydas TaxID=8469 RepID=M7B710_CHEMY|nr:Solute carrier family 35 member B1 [Chelonia mydas]
MGRDLIFFCFFLLASVPCATAVEKTCRTRAPRVRRTSSLDTILGSYLLGQWPRDADGAFASCMNDKATQTPTSWHEVEVGKASASTHKRSASWGSMDHRREIAKLKQQLQRTKLSGKEKDRSSPLQGDHAVLGSVRDSPPGLPPASPVLRLSPCLHRSLEGLNQELEEVFVKEQGDEELLRILDVPDGHRAPAPPQRGSEDLSLLTLEPSSSSCSSLSLSPSPSVPLRSSPHTPARAATEELSSTLEEPLPDPKEKESSQKSLPSLLEDGSPSPVLAFASSPRPNHSYMFKREPPEGCEKVRAFEEASSPSSDQNFLPSCPDKNKVHFNPTGSAFCPKAEDNLTELGEHVSDLPPGSCGTDREGQPRSRPRPWGGPLAPVSPPRPPPLPVCFLGVFVCYFYYGILQESITRGKYGEGAKQEKFKYALSLVFIQCVINAVFARLVIQFFDAVRVDRTQNWLYAACSLSYLGAMVSSNSALQFVNYPTQVLGKSCKPIPVMLLGVTVLRKKYPLAKYLCVLLIVTGVALFMYKPKRGGDGEDGHIFGYGELLLLLSLTLDGLTGVSQDHMRAHYQTGSNHMMLNVNLWSTLFLGAGILFTGELWEFVSFAERYPSILYNILLFGLTSALGQSFIFMTVVYFGPLTCSIITTTRKFFTILASVILFANPISMMQWVGTILVFMDGILIGFLSDCCKTVLPHTPCNLSGRSLAFINLFNVPRLFPKDRFLSKLNFLGKDIKIHLEDFSSVTHSSVASYFLKDRLMNSKRSL